MRYFKVGLRSPLRHSISLCSLQTLLDSYVEKFFIKKKKKKKKKKITGVRREFLKNLRIAKRRKSKKISA